MNQLIEQGVAKGLIAFDADQKNIAYKAQNKLLRFNDPEEKVRANAYLSLVFVPDQRRDISVNRGFRLPRR
jgi:type I restriction enzyme M protein